MDPHPPGVYWISLTYATFILEVGQNKRIQKAAPIAKWAVGKNIKEIIEYWIRRKQLLEWQILKE